MARTTKTTKKPSQKLSKAAAKSPSPAKSPTKTPGTDFPEVRSLIELMKRNGLAVFKFEQGDFKITLKTPAGAATLVQGPVPAQAPAAQPAPAPIQEKTTVEPEKSNYKEITSPMVGTFYASPSPENPSFVEVGKTVNPETVVCIIEAMKVMNEIKAEISGKVVEVVAENGKPVQFGQVLFRVS
jgi:acetyl-CoA carboxylase biotin carboxyl carrier protein